MGEASRCVYKKACLDLLSSARHYLDLLDKCLSHPNTGQNQGWTTRLHIWVLRGEEGNTDLRRLSTKIILLFFLEIKERPHLYQAKTVRDRVNRWDGGSGCKILKRRLI